MKKNNRIILNLFILVILLLNLIFPKQVFAAEEKNQEIPDYNSMMLINALIPGHAQFKLGQEKDGYLYLSSIPVSIIGQTLLFLYFWDNKKTWNPRTENNKTYLTQYETQNISKKWMLYAGLTISIYATLISSYSSYSAHRDFTDKFAPSNLKTGKENLSELIFSPFKAENIFTWDFFPVFPITVISSVQGSDFQSIGKFFTKQNVPFMGFNVNPIAGFGLNLLATVLLVLANASWEEIMYRGLKLEQSGVVSSSLSFGLAHIGNMLLPDTSVEDTLLQTGFATLFGFYAANRTMANNYDFRRMIALHFWHNVLSSSINYMVKPENNLFVINYSLKF